MGAKRLPATLFLLPDFPRNPDTQSRTAEKYNEYMSMGPMEFAYDPLLANGSHEKEAFRTPRLSDG